MLNRLHYFFMLCLLCSGVGLLLVVLTNNRAVNQLEGQINYYESEITREEEKIRNLQTEIAYLSRPQRIARLAKQYLPHLKTIDKSQLYVAQEYSIGADNAGDIIWQNNGKELSANQVFKDKDYAPAGKGASQR